MALRLSDKKNIVAEVAEQASNSVSAIGIDYRGLSVVEVTEFRNIARKNGVYLKVLRNTLAKRALEGTQFECMKDAFQGPTMLGLSLDDPGMAARIAKDFAKEHKALEVKILSIGGVAYGGDALEKIASLPTKQEALGQLASVTKAPVVKFVRTMAETYAKLVRVVNAVADKKKSSDN